MAGPDVTLNIDANLTAAQRKLQAFIQQSQRQMGSQSFAFKLDEKGFRQPLGRITGDLNQFQGAMDASIARTLAFGASVGAIAGVTKAFKDLVSVTIKVEHSLKEINVLLNLSTKDLQSFSKELFSVAKNTASSFDTVATAATEFSRQGLSAAETAKRVNSALILTRLSGLDAEASVSALTAAVNGFRREAISTTEVVNRLANVDAAFAVSSGDLAKALSRAGSVSQDAKVKFNELLAATTAVQQATARGGNVIGNGFKTIFTRLQRSKVRSELEKIGVATTDATGNIRGAIDVLKDYAKVYQTLSDQQKAYTSEQVAGVFQINTLKALVNDLSNEYGVYNRALAVANATTDEAVKRNAELNKTLQSLVSQTGTEIAELASKVGAISFEGNFKGILGFIKSALGDVNKTIDSEGIGGTLARGVLKGFGDFITGPGLAVALVGITRLLMFIGKQTKTALAQVFQIGTASQKRQVVQQKINALLMEDGNLLKQIMASSGNINDITAIVSRNILAQNTALSRQKLLVDQIAAGFALTKGGSIVPNVMPTRVPSGRGAFGRGAQGFVPNMVRSERSSISQGVGGARAGDRPVVIPNFSFGGGKSGTMVAHTGEHIVPNFARGGSAIFNRDMASSMGLPGGAVRVGAQGFVPNFMGASRIPVVLNKPFTTSSGKHFPAGAQSVTTSQYNAMAKKKGLLGKGVEATVDKPLVAPDALQTLVINAKNLGVAAALGQRGKNASPSQDALSLTTSGKKGAELISLKAAGTRGPKADKFDKFLLKNVQVRSLQKADDDDFGQKLFKNKISEHFANPLLDFGDDLLGGIFEPKKRTQIANKLKAQDPADLFSSSAEGGIFESAIRVITRGMKVSKPFSKEKNPFFDFEPGGAAQEKFIDAFDFNPLYKADAKRTANSENIRTLVSKALGDKGVRKRFLRQRGVVAQINRLKKKNTPTGVGTGRGAFGRGAEGFIPSFANLASIAASPAGKRAMATERALAGSSRMGYDSRVGYGVFNNSQGSLSNAISQHVNAGDSTASLASTGAAAQGVSAAEGYVPNFAGVGLALGGAIKGLSKALAKGTLNLGKTITGSFRSGSMMVKKDIGAGFWFGTMQLQAAAGVVAESLRKAEKEASAAKLTGTMTGAATGAGMGAMTGFPIAIAIGALAGGLVGFTASLAGVEAALLETAKVRAEHMEGATKDQQDVAAYMEKVNKVTQAETIPEKVAAEEDLSSHLALMSPTVSANVLALGDNTDAIQMLMIEMKREALRKDLEIELQGARDSQKQVQQTQERVGKGKRARSWLFRTFSNDPEGRRKIEEQGASARETFIKRGRSIASDEVDFKVVDPKAVSQISHDLDRITKLEYKDDRGMDPTDEGWFGNLGSWLFKQRGENEQFGREGGYGGIDPYQGDEFLSAGIKSRDKTVGEILTKDLGMTMDSIPEELKKVFDVKLSELSAGYTGEDVNINYREAAETMKGLLGSTAKHSKKWAELEPIRLQKQADRQAKILEEKLNAMRLDESKILGGVARSEGRRVQKDTATAKFLDQLGGIEKARIGDDADMTKLDKAKQVQAIEVKAIERGEGIAIDKQQTKFLGEIAKELSEAEPGSEEADELQKIATALQANRSAEDIFNDELLNIQGTTRNLLQNQVDALDSIKTAAIRQGKILELNGLRQAAILEETRRQRVKTAIESTSKNILKEGHDLRSAFYAITQYGDNVGRASGPDLRAQSGMIAAYDVLLKHQKGLVSDEYYKETEGKREALVESVAIGGIADTLANNLRKMVIGEAGGKGFDNVDQLLAAMQEKISLVQGGDQDLFKRIYADSGIGGKQQRAQWDLLMNYIKEIQSARGENKQAKDFEKAFNEAFATARRSRDETALGGKGRMGISAQAGVINLKNLLQVAMARESATADLIHLAEDTLTAGSDQEIKEIKHAIIAALDQVPELSDKFIEDAKGEEVPKLLEYLKTHYGGQGDRVEQIKKTLAAIQAKEKKLTDNTEAIGLLTKAITSSKLFTAGQIDPDNAPAPQTARGFIPSLAGGGISAALMRERRDIRNGVGGAIPGLDRARMVNLNGRPAAINDGEKLINNYRGTGQTAVLTRNMQSTMQVSRGYVPNFASGQQWNVDKIIDMMIKGQPLPTGDDFINWRGDNVDKINQGMKDRFPHGVDSDGKPKPKPKPKGAKPIFEEVFEGGKSKPHAGKPPMGGGGKPPIKLPPGAGAAKGLIGPIGWAILVAEAFDLLGIENIDHALVPPGGYPPGYPFGDTTYPTGPITTGPTKTGPITTKPKDESPWTVPHTGPFVPTEDPSNPGFDFDGNPMPTAPINTYPTVNKDGTVTKDGETWTPYPPIKTKPTTDEDPPPTVPIETKPTTKPKTEPKTGWQWQWPWSWSKPKIEPQIEPQPPEEDLFEETKPRPKPIPPTLMYPTQEEREGEEKPYIPTEGTVPKPTPTLEPTVEDKTFTPPTSEPIKDDEQKAIALIFGPGADKTETKPHDPGTQPTPEELFVRRQEIRDKIQEQEDQRARDFEIRRQEAAEARGDTIVGEETVSPFLIRILDKMDPETANRLYPDIYPKLYPDKLNSIPLTPAQQEAQDNLDDLNAWEEMLEHGTDGENLDAFKDWFKNPKYSPSPNAGLPRGDEGKLLEDLRKRQYSASKMAGASLRSGGYGGYGRYGGGGYGGGGYGGGGGYYGGGGGGYGGYASGYIPNMAKGRSPWWDKDPTQPRLGVTTDDPKEFADQMRSWHRYLELTAGAKTGTPDIDMPMIPVKPPTRKSITVSNIQGGPLRGIHGGGQRSSPARSTAPSADIKTLPEGWTPGMPSIDPSMRGKGFDTLIPDAAPSDKYIPRPPAMSLEEWKNYGKKGYHGAPAPSFVGKGHEPVYGRGGKVIGSAPKGRGFIRSVGGYTKQVSNLPTIKGTQSGFDAAKKRWATEAAEEKKYAEMMDERHRNALNRLTRHSEGYIPNLSEGSQMIPNMNASNHFLNSPQGSAPAAGSTSNPSATSFAGAETPGQALISHAKASQEKHNVNVNIEVYGNLSQDQVDQVQAKGSDMATVLEELVNGGL